jgi:hypothetical protein
MLPSITASFRIVIAVLLADASGPRRGDLDAEKRRRGGTISATRILF